MAVSAGGQRSPFHQTADAALGEVAAGCKDYPLNFTVESSAAGGKGGLAMVTKVPAEKNLGVEFRAYGAAFHWSMWFSTHGRLFRPSIKALAECCREILYGFAGDHRPPKRPRFRGPLTLRVCRYVSSDPGWRFGVTFPRAGLRAFAR